MADISITIQWPWLKYTIDQETYKSAHSLITGDAVEDRIMEAQTATDTFDAAFCRRTIMEACTKLQDATHKFFGGLQVKDSTDNTISTPNNDTLLSDAYKWIITFTNLGSRRNVMPQLLSKEVHQYVVLNVLQEWSKLTNPALEQNYVSRLVAEENRIKSILYRKEPPTRPSQNE